MTCFLKKNFAIVTLFSLVLTGESTISAAYADSVCNHPYVKHFVSPNNAWDAVVDEEYCEGDYSFATNGVTTVTIVSLNNPSKYEDVFTIDTTGGIQEIPSVSWISSTNLQILANQGAITGIQKNGFSIIKISYTYH